MGVVIGIDPGVNFTGVVVYSNYREKAKIEAVRLIKRRSKDLASNALHQVFELRQFIKIGADEHVNVIVEMPRVYPRTDRNKVRPNDIVDLTYMAGALGAALVGLSNVTLVYPKTWKGSVPKKQHNARILKKLPGFENHLNKSAIPKGQHEHVIDAAGIGLWYIERNK